MTLQTWKWQENRDFTERLPEDANIDPISTMQVLSFLTTLYILNGINLRMLWQTIQRCLNLVLKRWKFLWEARIHSYECALGQSWWELGKNHPASTGNKSFHFDGFPSLTTLCRDHIMCNVYRIMTSWRRRLPRISLAACLMKEHSGSFNVLNHWLRGPCNSRMRVKQSQHETSEPAGTRWRLNIDPMNGRRDFLDARTLEKVVATTLDFYIVNYIMRGSRRSYRCNPEKPLNNFPH